MAYDIEWALGEVQRLEELLRDPTFRAENRRAELVPAAEYLRTRSGARSLFYIRAEAALQRLSPDAALGELIGVLRGWVEFVEAGLAIVPLESQARIDAATDLMVQVDMLLDDIVAHPAAPIILAGAALEEFLMAMTADCPEQPNGKPGIESYAEALERAGLLSEQDVKDVSSWALLRNAVAHGRFDVLSIELARVMAQSINLFMRQKERPYLGRRGL